MASTATTASAAELLRPTSRLFSFNGVDEEDRLDKVAGCSLGFCAAY